MAESPQIRIHPIWRETPDYALLAMALIHLAEQLQEKERQAETSADATGTEDDGDA